MEVNFEQVHKKVLQAVEQQVKSRCVRASNILKERADDILSNKRGRSGRIYRKPHTKHATYQASAPGEPPALRTGDLRRSWKPLPYSQMKAGENMFTPGIRTDVKYAPALQHGTPKVAARPFEDEIKQAAWPEIKAIFDQAYL